MRLQGKHKGVGEALDQNVDGEKKISFLIWERSDGIEHLKLFSSHVPSLEMKLTKKDNGNVQKERDECS